MKQLSQVAVERIVRAFYAVRRRWDEGRTRREREAKQRAIRVAHDRQAIRLMARGAHGIEHHRTFSIKTATSHYIRRVDPESEP